MKQPEHHPWKRDIANIKRAEEERKTFLNGKRDPDTFKNRL